MSKLSTAHTSLSTRTSSSVHTSSFFDPHTRDPCSKNVASQVIAKEKRLGSLSDWPLSVLGFEEGKKKKRKDGKLEQLKKPFVTPVDRIDDYT